MRKLSEVLGSLLESLHESEGMTAGDLAAEVHDIYMTEFSSATLHDVKWFASQFLDAWKDGKRTEDDLFMELVHPSSGGGPTGTWKLHGHGRKKDFRNLLRKTIAVMNK